MGGGLSFCQDTNQGLQMLGAVVGKGQLRECDYEFDEVVAYLQNYDLLGKDIYFANRTELGKFLIDEQNKFKAGLRSLNSNQKMVFDRALYDILGRRLYV